MTLGRDKLPRQTSQLISTYTQRYRDRKIKDALMVEGLQEWPLQNLGAKDSSIKGECSWKDYTKIRGSKCFMPQNRRTMKSLYISTLHWEQIGCLIDLTHVWQTQEPDRSLSAELQPGFQKHCWITHTTLIKQTNKPKTKQNKTPSKNKGILGNGIRTQCRINCVFNLLLCNHLLSLLCFLVTSKE